jgi:hypothetical protein
MDGCRTALLGWRSERKKEKRANGLHGCAPYPPSSRRDAHGREAGTSVRGPMGDVNENSVFVLGVMVERITSCCQAAKPTY